MGSTQNENNNYTDNAACTHGGRRMGYLGTSTENNKFFSVAPLKTEKTAVLSSFFVHNRFTYKNIQDQTDVDGLLLAFTS